MEERTCEACGKAKPLTSEYWKKTPKGFTMQCSACIQAKALATRQNNKQSNKTVQKIWSDEELEGRYQKVLKNTTDKGLVYKRYEFRIGDRVKVIRIDPEDKFGLYKEIRGTIISKTREFIVVEKVSSVRECFRYIDIAIGDYRVEGAK